MRAWQESVSRPWPNWRGCSPVQVIDPEIHRLIEEGPNRRRRFIDWGVFHVERSFVEHWQRYQQTLRQRNAALKARQDRAVVTAWDVELVRYGELITEARRRYVALLAPVASHRGPAAAGSGARPQPIVRDGPRNSICAWPWIEVSRGTRSSVPRRPGPHRADLAIRLEGAAVKDRDLEGTAEAAGGSAAAVADQAVSSGLASPPDAPAGRSSSRAR